MTHKQISRIDVLVTYVFDQSQTCSVHGFLALCIATLASNIGIFIHDVNDNSATPGEVVTPCIWYMLFTPSVRFGETYTRLETYSCTWRIYQALKSFEIQTNPSGAHMWHIRAVLF